MTLLSTVAAPEATPIDAYLAGQQNLTAVDVFSRSSAHDLRHAQEPFYRALLPVSTPGPGEQYGFAVDLDACTGCKACVTACHSLNGLDEGESWRKVSLLRSTDVGSPRQQTLTSGCHHCVDPACLRGCPVNAYEKDRVTGIVVHLDDQCIGCTYCTLACPYEVPVYNPTRGIVRKCDMCTGRLAAGEAPACVQGCPNGAISIAVVSVSGMRDRAGVPGSAIAPGAPPSHVTVPTTVYTSRRPDHTVNLGTARVEAEHRPAPAHVPLSVMLVLTQVSVGTFVGEQILRAAGMWRAFGLSGGVGAGVAGAVGVLALAASVLHLGRPRYCYRAILGIRHSWLSREAVALGAFTAAACAYAASSAVNESLASPALAMGVRTLGWLASAFGVLGVTCSGRLYTITGRSTWSNGRVAALFIGTMVMGGGSVLTTVSAWSAALRHQDLAWTDPLRVTLALVVGASMVKVGCEVAIARHLRADNALSDHPGRRIALLTRTHLGTPVRLHLVCLAIVATLGGWLLVAMRGTLATAIVSSLALIAMGVGELTERWLFFTMVSQPSGSAPRSVSAPAFGASATGPRPVGGPAHDLVGSAS